MRIKSFFSAILCIHCTCSLLFSDIFLQGYNSFVWDLYAQVSADQEVENRSIVLSPFSTATVLSMTAAGASKSTLKEMEEVLGYPINMETIQAQKKVRENLLPSFQTFQAVAVAKKFTVLPSFTSIVSSGFNAMFFHLDFASNKRESLQAINGWIDSCTHKLIPELLSDQDISSSTRLILLNASHFKKAWKFPFNISSTKKSQFFPNSGESIEVDMMQQSGYFPLYENDKCQVLNFDFKAESEGDDFCSFLILPKSQADMKQVELLLAQGLLDIVKQERKNAYVDISLPRFIVRQKLSLKEALVKMGMLEAFSSVSADFSHMSDKELLYIDNVIGEAIVTVDEAGCEAASATAAVMNMRASRHSEPVVMRFDRPFIFIIYQKNEGIVLFVSRVNAVS